MSFVGRVAELEELERRYDAPDGQLVLLAGRRRIGKTYLLQQFTGRHPGRTIFYQATRQAESRELEAFTALVARELGGLPPGFAFPRWEAALEWLDERAGAERLVVVLDEYPYLTESTPGLSSVIQRWWDRRGRSARAMLVLCGSEQAVMDDLDRGASPLHQRFTAKLHLNALAYDEPRGCCRGSRRPISCASTRSSAARRSTFASGTSGRRSARICSASSATRAAP